MGHRHLILFEDERAARFEPVALTRSVARLRLGAWTFRERWERRFVDRELGLITRHALAAAEREPGDWRSVNEPLGGDALFVAASAFGGEPQLGAIRGLEPGQALLCGDRLLAARSIGEDTGRLASGLGELAGTALLAPRHEDAVRFAESLGLAVVDVPGAIAEHLVDLMLGNAGAITADFAEYERLMAPPVPRDYPGVHFIEPARIRLAEGVRLDPGCVLDAREGPILIGPGTQVRANSVIAGPVAIGAGCLIKPLTRVLDGVSLGPVCRVGGEIDATILQGYSNKQHDGFLGHSYLGRWVNLGAATDTSDLKNDYGWVKVSLAGETVDTKSRGVGSLIGDHTKTSIHTQLNTGTVLGVSCNVFGAGFPPKAVPSYSWGGSQEWHPYRLEKALAVARTVTARRQVDLTPAQEAVLRTVHEETAASRAEFSALPAA